jgi:hypothetical protein
MSTLDVDRHHARLAVAKLSNGAKSARVSVRLANEAFAVLADKLALGTELLDEDRVLVTGAVRALTEAKDQAEGLLGRIAQVVK